MQISLARGNPIDITSLPSNQLPVFMRGELRVAGELSRPYGRNPAIVSLVRDFVDRDRGTDGLHSRRTPVLLLTGPRGTGKTGLLAELAGLLDQNVPYAQLDGEWPIESPQDLLLLLACYLNRRSGKHDTLAFPRLLTGEIVITADLTLNIANRPDALKRISDLLATLKIRGVLEDMTSTLLRTSLELLSSDPVTMPIKDFIAKYGAKLLLGGLNSFRGGGATLLGEGREWYGKQDRGLGRNPLDVLFDLRLAATRAQAQPEVPDSDSAREVAQLLWAAFLADLRAAFRDRKAVNWVHNCVLLLDNADTAVARSFLSELISARRERDEPDPLTVVATSRGELTEQVSEPGATPLAGASYAHYLARAEPGLATWWYPVLLPPLSWPKTKDKIEALQLPALSGTAPATSVPALTTSVHAFTGGHPGATTELLDAMAEQPKLAPAVLAVLAARKQDTRANSRRPVEEAILASLLKSLPAEAPAAAEASAGAAGGGAAGGGMDSALAEDLATCAAARHRDAALRMAIDSRLMEQLPGEETAIFAAEFWSEDTQAARRCSIPCCAGYCCGGWPPAARSTRRAGRERTNGCATTASRAATRSGRPTTRWRSPRCLRHSTQPAMRPPQQDLPLSK
jgi:hypothetical protein